MPCWPAKLVFQCLEHSCALSSVRRICSSIWPVSSTDTHPTTSVCRGGPRTSVPPTSYQVPHGRWTWTARQGIWQSNSCRLPLACLWATHRNASSHSWTQTVIPASFSLTSTSPYSERLTRSLVKCYTWRGNSASVVLTLQNTVDHKAKCVFKN